MKLVDILARDLKEWPVSAEFAVQDCDNLRTIKFAGEDHSALGRGLVDNNFSVWQAEDWDCGTYHDFDCSELSSDHATAIVTRAQWQAAVDALKSENCAHLWIGWADMEACELCNETRKVAVEWNGEGLPPVGTVCELRAHKLNVFSPAIIRFASRNVVVWDWKDEPALHGLCTAYAHDVEIRPIRTAEQIAAEERDSVVEDIRQIILSLAPDEYNPADERDMGRALYDAGYRKQVSE